MIDSVLKGTGNSRFLKSAVPTGTSWADALAMLHSGTFPIDFNGINTEGFQQVGTPLNKANLLKDATAAQIGLPPSTTPDGMFRALGNTGELHVWRKTVTTAQEIPAGYTLGDAESGTAFSVPNAGSQNYVTLQYGPSITVNDGGGVSLTSVTGSVEFKQYSNVSAIYDIRNNFVKAIPNGTYTSAFDGVIFVPNDCSFKNTAGIVTFGKFYRVNAYPKTPAGTTTTYPVSTNPNAYQEGSDAKPAGYVLGEVVTGNFSLTVKGNGSTTITWLYSSAVTVSDNGEISFVDSTSSVINAYGYASNAQKFKGKFCKTSSEGTDFAPNEVCFIPANASIVQSGDKLVVDRYQPVTGYAAIPAGTTIEYLGKLGDKARVQVVSYVGTGTYGSSNPNSLTFDFVPKLVLVALSKDKSNNPNVRPEPNDGWRNMFLWIHGMAMTGMSQSTIYFTNDGKKLSWYASNYAGSQCNESGSVYTAVAIG